MRYLLDTNICIYIAKKSSPALLARFEKLPAGETGMSVVTYLELIYGARKSQRVATNLSTIHELTAAIPVLPLDTSCADHFGRLRVDLERRGVPIGAYDLLIASHALSLNSTLITHNTREFSRIPHLKMADWT